MVESRPVRTVGRVFNRVSVGIRVKVNILRVSKRYFVGLIRIIVPVFSYSVHIGLGDYTTK